MEHVCHKVTRRRRVGVFGRFPGTWYSRLRTSSGPVRPLLVLTREGLVEAKGGRRGPEIGLSQGSMLFTINLLSFNWGTSEEDRLGGTPAPSDTYPASSRLLPDPLPRLSPLVLLHHRVPPRSSRRDSGDPRNGPG